MRDLPALRDEAEIVVVGAGPAGCAAAAGLAELGHDVLLVDKCTFPREKPCGDGLTTPAVEVAERLGLGELIESSPEIDSVQAMVGHRRLVPINFSKVPGKPLPRCIPRMEFDVALHSSAIERGARFLHARIDDLDRDGSQMRLLAVDGDDPFEIQAGLVIAADGATSRIRRSMSEEAEKPTAYAIRQYFRTERPLDSVFHVDIPIEVDGRVLPAYGWVFPIDQHTANIGLGFTRESHYRAPSLRAMLGAYVSELKSKAARRFGDIEPIGEPLGSPVGIRSRIEVAGLPGVALVGDAACTTSPFTGEGISFALRGGEALAAAVHERSKRGDRSMTGVDAEVWPAFPQLGVDASLVVRGAALIGNEVPSAPESLLGAVPEPFLTAVWRMSFESAYETGVEGTPAWEALEASEPQLADILGEINHLLLERLSDPTPFVTEVIHDSIRSHLGPMHAAVVLATATDGGESLPQAALDAGVAVESASALPKLLTMLVDRAGSKKLKLNNAMAMLTGDFTATRALTAAAKLGPEAAIALLRTSQGGCQGGMRDAVARFATDRTLESWLQAATETEGAAMILATQFGVIARGEKIEAAAGLREFGLELGVAIRLAEEIVELIGGTGLEGQAISRGIYSLPILYAIEAEPSLPRLLAQSTAEQRGPAEIVTAVRESGALDRAVAECKRRADLARSSAKGWGGNDGEALAALAALPAEYVTSHVSADALEAR